MDRPYKIILILTFFATITLMGLLATQSERAPLNLLFLGLVTFTILSTSYGIFYYFLQKSVGFYKQSLIFSACLTAFLFAMDYMVWDKDPPNPSAHI